MLKRIHAWFAALINRIENNSTPFARYYYLFGAILALRLTLEFFSSRRLFTRDDILHIGLWFIFIVLAFMLQLQLFSGERMRKLAKLVIVCFSIALTAPIIDLLLTQGQGAKMNYLSLNSWGDVARNYITIGGSSFSRGATPGIRIEIVLMLVASFNYVYIKTGKLWRSLLSVLCIYTVLFLSGAIPFLLGIIIKTFHLEYRHNDQSTVLLLLCLNLVLLFGCCLRHVPKTLRRIVAHIPWAAAVWGLLHLVAGALLARQLYPANWQLTPTTLFELPLLLALACMLALVSGVQTLQRKGVVGLQPVANGLLLLLLAVSGIISAPVFFMTALAWGLLFLLYEPPVQLYKIPGLRHLLQAMLLPAAALLGFTAFGGPMIGFPAVWLWGMLAAGLIAALVAERIVRR